MTTPPAPDTDDKAPRDPAASMSLLTQILFNPLDAGYSYYSKEDDAHQPWWRRLLVVVIAVGFGLASFAAVSSLRTPASASITAELLEQVQSRQTVVNALDADIQSLSAYLTSRAESGQSSARLSPEIALVNSLTPVTGSGLTVTLSDSDNARALSRSGGGVVRDLDLNVVVNALWSAGAEAITINGIRVGPSTFIRTAGSVILVNITPVQSPYTVSAIGDANELSVALVRGATGDYLSSAKSLNGISISTAAQRDIDMPGLDLRTTRSIEILDVNEGE